MTTSRPPGAFDVPGMEKPDRDEAHRPRQPRAITGKRLQQVVPEPVEIFDDFDREAPPPIPARRRGLRLGRIFAAAFGLLVTFAVGIWAERVVSELFARAQWLGWTAAIIAVIAAVALVAILLREGLAIARLASVEKLRSDGETVMRAGSLSDARTYVRRLSGFLAARPQTAAGRASLTAVEDDVMDAADLVGLAERELLAPLDAEARTLILDAAKRVSVVTAVSPRALVDIAYILYEAGKLIRRLAELYGARPGTLGYVRLVRNVLAHLAVTGAMAVGDEFVHQVVGQGLAARLSARLGEGVVNGAMTVRVGLAAMDVVRPLPFVTVRRPGIGDFVASLASFSKQREAGAPAR